MATKVVIGNVCSLMFLCMFLECFSIKVKNNMFFMFFNLQINVFNIYGQYPRLGKIGGVVVDPTWYSRVTVGQP